MTDPIAEARKLLAERTPGDLRVPPRLPNGSIVVAEWREGNGIRSKYLATFEFHEDAEFFAAAPRLLAALCDRLEAAEREFRQSHEANCVPDYTERGLHSSWCRLYMVGPE